MPALPRVLVEAYEQTESGPGAARRPLGKVDLTLPVLERLIRYGKLPDDGLRVMDIGSALGKDIAPIAWSGNLALPTLNDTVSEFLSEVGGETSLPAFRNRLQEVERARWRLESAVTTASRVASASLGAAPGPGDNIYDGYADEPHRSFGQGHHGEPWFEEFLRDNPTFYPIEMSEDPTTAKERAELDAKLSDARNAQMPPFVFATSAIYWSGIYASDVRETMKDEGDVDVESLIDSGMDDHHEDARDHVVDEYDLVSLVERWKPHAGKGTPEDLALEGQVAEWNARQVLVSYEPDFGQVLPTVEAATHAMMLDHANSVVASIGAEISRMEANWEPPPPVAAPSMSS